MGGWTDARIKALPTPNRSPKRYFEGSADRTLKGFGIQILPSGARSFLVAYTSPVTGKRRTMALGGYPSVSLAQGREHCRDARKLLAAGLDPIEQRDQASAKERALARHARELGTVEDLFNLYCGRLEDHGQGHTPRQVRSIYKRDIGPAIGI
ncbi:MAG: Arm DNA-binding domain-containing protein [Aquisalimonadaceae bacterium]